VPRQFEPEQPLPDRLVSVKMRAAIPRLQRRIAELQAIDVSTIREVGEIRFNTLKHKTNSTLADIFGFESIEYRRFSINTLDPSPNLSISAIQEGYKRNLDQAISDLDTIKVLFEERIGEFRGSPAGRALDAYNQLEIRPEIERAVERLFRDGHYANAVEDACKVIDDLVQIRSGRSDLSGTDLMHKVFSPNDPILKFNELQTETDQSEQRGMMYLFAGAMLALRNPRAHAIMEDDPEQALEYIAFLNLLARSLDRAQRVRSGPVSPSTRTGGLTQ